MSAIATGIVVGQPVMDTSDQNDASATKKADAFKQVPPSVSSLGQGAETLPGWTVGLKCEVIKSLNEFPVRFVIVDNSGSMNTPDGQRLVETSNGDLRPVTATRWEELGDCVYELAKVTNTLKAETHFHLLNPTNQGQFFVLNQAKESPISAYAGAKHVGIPALKRVMQTPCEYSTPLTEAVDTISNLLRPSAAMLRASGKRAVVIVATDGLPNDATSFLRAMQELQRLPAWIIVRLCTNDDSVVDYWNELDRHLESPLEVIDDLAGEAREAHRHNPWLVCPPALHLARTAGVKDNLFDLVDEKPLAPSQIKQLIERLLRPAGTADGARSLDLAEPELEPALFIKQVRQLIAPLPRVYNPISKRMGPWVDIGALERSLRRRMRGDSAHLCTGAADAAHKAATQFCTVS